MRFNAKELACVAQEKSSYFDFESSLFVKEKPEGIFKKSKGINCVSRTLMPKNVLHFLIIVNHLC